MPKKCPCWRAWMTGKAWADNIWQHGCKSGCQCIESQWESILLNDLGQCLWFPRLMAWRSDQPSENFAVIISVLPFQSISPCFTTTSEPLNLWTSEPQIQALHSQKDFVEGFATHRVQARSLQQKKVKHGFRSLFVVRFVHMSLACSSFSLSLSCNLWTLKICHFEPHIEPVRIVSVCWPKECQNRLESARTASGINSWTP